MVSENGFCHRRNNKPCLTSGQQQWTIEHRKGEKKLFYELALGQAHLFQQTETIISFSSNRWQIVEESRPVIKASRANSARNSSAVWADAIFRKFFDGMAKLSDIFSRLLLACKQSVRGIDVIQILLQVNFF